MPGNQDADTTRATYFAGDAAMVIWSSFLLDELAGLRNDAAAHLRRSARKIPCGWPKTPAFSLSYRARAAPSRRPGVRSCRGTC